MVMEIVVSAVLLLVGIAVLVVIHVCIVGRAFRGEREGIWRSNLGKNLSNQDLEKLPCYEYKSGEKQSTNGVDLECVVCLEGFKTGERCRLLPNCRHSFHVECIDSWLLKTPICPICRTCAAVPKFGLVLEHQNDPL
ncbi:RING-H2 finger protein ATL56-like [Cucurbita maxima]|uniref:RING-H2 finger protein ATL56-like n=1 Tax=Cucurbita maxima TaxID=3661 RepID=A0A6J1JUU5_CUCMA|nr:RING-H2 finger protein ATL56-like [Cucurbita maxima]